MSRRGVLLMSVGVNLFLAVAVAFLAKAKFSAPLEKISTVTKVVTNAAAQKNSPEVPVTVTNVTAAGFHWREIESGEYPVYVANLRKVNCPEKTIRSILIPDIEELYDKRRRDELESPATNFWMSGRARAAFNRERQRQSRALDAEESTLVKQLLGIDWFRSEHRRGFSHNFEEIALPYLLTATLSIEKTKDFSIVIQKYERLEREIQDETGGILLPEDEARLKELKARMKSEVVQLISPQECEEFGLRMATIQGNDIFEDLKDSDLLLSPDEFRKIMQLKVAGRDMPFEFKIFSSGSDDELTPQQIKEIEQATKTFLGDERYTKFQEATDGNFKSAKQFVETQKLPPQTSRALYEVQQAAENQAEEIRVNQSLNAADRKRALQEVRATTEAALARMFDEKTLKTYYKEQGNNWLPAISKNPK